MHCLDIKHKRHDTINQLLKWKVKFIIPEPQNRLLWLYKFTSYSLVWALTLDPRTSDPFRPTYLQVKAPKENSRQKNKHKNLKHCINNVVKPIWKKELPTRSLKKEISAIANVIKETEFQSVRATWKAIIRRPYIKLTQMLLRRDSAKIPIRYINWQYVEQWTECPNEINVLRGISNPFVPLAALPLTNQYTCRELHRACPNPDTHTRLV